MITLNKGKPKFHWEWHHLWITSALNPGLTQLKVIMLLDSQDHDLSSGVPLWQSSVTPPCYLPHWVSCKDRWSLSTGGCAPLHPELSTCLFSPPGDRKVWEGWNEGHVCLDTGGSMCSYAALCVTPALIPAHISKREKGKAAVFPSELQLSGCLPPWHTWGIEELSSKTLSNIPKWQRTMGSWCTGNTHFEHVGTMSDFLF